MGRVGAKFFSGGFPGEKNIVKVMFATTYASNTTLGLMPLMLKHRLY